MTILVILKINNLNPPKYNEKFFQYIYTHLDDTINRIKLLIEENLDPVIKSFDQWEKVLINFQSTLNFLENSDYYFNYKEMPLSDVNFIDSDLYKPYINTKSICNKIFNRVKENKSFFEDFKKEYEKNNSSNINSKIFPNIESVL